MAQIPITPDAIVGDPESGGTHAVGADLAYQRLGIVNVVYVGAEGARQWVLVDAGVHGTARLIRRAAAARYGKDSRPIAIVLTHGHFDHVGALEALVEEWDVPIYAHDLEVPYLTGAAKYPEPDPGVGGGLMARLSVLYPRGPFDFSRWLRTLPADGAVPGMPGWRWLHTPGHTQGHVAFWREADRTLIAGDAFITTAQESAYAVATQKPELHGPPMYFTEDWLSARASVRQLAALDPSTVITMHGRAMGGPAMREALHRLAARFDEVAVPREGDADERISDTGRSGA